MSWCADASVGQTHAVKCELAGEVLRSFGNLRFKATGWSMLPSVWPGDTLVVERVGLDRVRVGDVVLVGGNGRLQAHRVVSLAEGCGSPRWITQGDANPAPDQHVSGDELLGRVAYLIRAGKLIPVPAELSVVNQLIAKIVRRSGAAARALVYLHRAVETPKESLSCQG
ncbi:MAG: S24/S26 family peptidase [Candidatus Sulfotelmatobacter sp.]